MPEIKTILIIEQEVNLANGLKSILEKGGYRVVSTYNYYEVQNAFKNGQPDLAIVDISIPKELGLNILRNIKELSPLLPIIAISVYSNSFSNRELNILGADDFIAKPFDIGNLKEKIKQLINKDKRKWHAKTK